ncbi:MAG: UDP-glucose/GDP-mannose dehydrogenase family protein, partial [Moraxellaceae bacterium]|nr:UDP-glucose/GDP-mannose dehydrogenase family protein [Pseudobdellovibrionaceae bacterium]
MKISVFGTGYVGLVSGLGFAEMGHQVLCYDVDSKKISQLIQRTLPIYEADAERLLLKHTGRKIQFTDHFETAVNFSDVIFLCVNLHQHKKGHTETQKLISLIEQIKNKIEQNKVIVLKSTAPVGTHLALERRFKKNKSKPTIEFITNPEFLSEGEAVQNFLKPDRIIIGGASASAIKKLKKIYQPWIKKNIPLIQMDANSAEMTKHAANCMLATRVSFINEISRLCEKSKCDISLVKAGLSLDPRIGSMFLNPGPGYGGSCLPKDISSVIHLGESLDENMHLLKAVRNTNDKQISHTISKIEAIIKKNKIRQITIWGASYKAGTDDLRCSVAFEIIGALAIHKIKIHLHDPAALSNLEKLDLPPNIELF